MAADVETIVVGAGVVGLAIGRALAMKGHEVMVVEQHDLIGSETSSRNSEVIHAGLYYAPGSWRAKLCVAGKEAMYQFCAENGVGHSRCEKLLVATNEDQHGKLKAIIETAERNGINDLVPLTASEARKLEPAVRCTAALLSPSTGIIDTHSYMVALEGHITSRGGQVVLQSPVTGLSIQPDGNEQVFAVEIAGADKVTCRNLVLSAGLHASKVARHLSFANGYTVPITYYAKGQYYALSGASPFKRHIYPMPQGAWLGLHATVDLGGRCKFGPDIEWTPEIDYTFEPEKLTQFLDFIRSYYPDLEPSKLHADYTGVRPKLYREGEPVPDFRFDDQSAHGVERLVMLYGIESPGLTASLAIADHVAAML